MEVQPDKQNIDSLFSNTTYYIDFYQRQYTWNEEPVKRLLEDIFYKFTEEFIKFQSLELSLDLVINKYSWYFLNTYVTNSINGKLYIVDGQQRLTTLTLILIKLKHLASVLKSPLEDWISSRIVGKSGYNTDFWMNHEKNKDCLNQLFISGNIPNPEFDHSTTGRNLAGNYKLISSRLDNELTTLKKFESFVFYFLKRLVLIRLDVDQTDVAMVFEVINDRGVNLKSHEILKGKLLGQVAKEELEGLALNELWDSQLLHITGINNSQDDIDQFFLYFLKAKFAYTKNDAQRYDNQYHRVIFSENKLNLNHNPQEVKRFLRNEFKYFTSLYVKINKLTSEIYGNTEFRSVFFNSLTSMNTQYLLILSSCCLDDPYEDIKIQTIAYEVDRLFCLLQLQGSYDNNAFTTSIYKICASIREKHVSEIRQAFDLVLLDLIEETKGITPTHLFSYTFFKDTGFDLEKRFIRYFFGRIEDFIATSTNVGVRHSLKDLVSKTGSSSGFHIEHILSNNEENLELYEGDEDIFNKDRNRLGSLLLLKGKDNISSNNEVFSQKLKSYANTLYWNETLREDSYKSKLDFDKMRINLNLNFTPVEKFGPIEVEERHRLLYEIALQIWH